VAELLLNECLSNKEIAKRLGIAERTVKAYIAQLYARAGLSNSKGTKRVQLVHMLAVPQEKIPSPVKLTPQEWKVARLVAEGMSSREIATSVECSLNVVKNYIYATFDKVGVWTRLELAAWVRAHGQ
jgi:DNA-binding NarL/FixJ family response regulator